MITAILQYSTIDYRFLKCNLDQLSKFCDEIIKYGITQQEELALTGGQTRKINEGKSCKLRNRRIPNGTYGGVRGQIGN